jgi:DedD protein
MDEQLKARLIGAVVLVAIAVLLIPELLSGRKAETPAAAEGAAAHGTRTYTIELAGGAATPSATPAAGSQPKPSVSALPVPPQSLATAPVEDTDPAPADGATSASGPETTAAASPGAVKSPAGDAAGKAAVAASAPPAQVAAAPPPAKPAAAVTKGGFAVQVGAFSTAAAANKLIADLKAAGFAAYPSPVPRSGKTLHRVRVGPVGARPEADQLATKLKARGLPATVVTND